MCLDKSSSLETVVESFLSVFVRLREASERFGLEGPDSESFCLLIDTVGVELDCVVVDEDGIPGIKEGVKNCI